MPYKTDALTDRLILIAEDQYLLADALVAAIQSAGGGVAGPFATCHEALAFLLQADRQPHAAALNVTLEDRDSYPVAEILAEQGIPFVFCSGNAASSFPAGFASAPLLSKPYTPSKVVEVLEALTAVDAPSLD